MRRSRLTTLGLLALSFSFATRAGAQTADVQSVTEREKLQQADLGIHLGSFLVLPQLDLTMNHGDNIDATDTNKRGDFYLNTRIAVAVNSDFSRNALNASAYYDRDTYFKLTSENTSQYGAQLDGRYDVGADGGLTVAGGYDRVAESRTSLDSFFEASSPVLYDLYHGSASFSDRFGRLATVFGVQARHYTYHDADLGNQKIDQSFRDFTVVQGNVDLAYDIHSLTNLIVHGSIERRRYDERFGDADFNPATTTDQSANGVRIEVGIQRQITSLLQATVRGGWLHYSYPDPRLRSLGAASYHADLIWNLTPLTTIQGSADRRVDETVSTSSAGNLRDEFRLAVRHELLRNLVLLFDTRYANIRPTAFNDTVAAGLTLAHSREFEISGGAHYYIGRYVRLDASVLHTQRRSMNSTIAFTENVGTIGVTFSR
jgi:hypothetical protein